MTNDTLQRLSVEFETLAYETVPVTSTNLRYCNDGSALGGRGNSADIAFAAITERHMSNEEKKRVDYKLMAQRNRRWERLVADAEANNR